MSVHLSEAPFAIGHTAEIYAWQPGSVLKLFNESFTMRAIEHEAHVARVVHDAGLPVPAVIGDIVEINGRYGLIYERIAGTSMLTTATSRPWLVVRYARQLAELHADVHSHKGIPGLPAQHAKLRRKIQSAEMLPDDTHDAVLKLLADLPAGDHLCHGDFHPDNILLTAKGAVIIDWIDANNGNPLADVARSSILMSCAPLPKDKRMRWLLDWFRELSHRVYLKRYFQLRPGDRQALAKWRIVNAAARLSEGIPESRTLCAFVRNSLPPTT